jgi:hypothetical protein
VFVVQRPVSQCCFFMFKHDCATWTALSQTHKRWAVRQVPQLTFLSSHHSRHSLSFSSSTRYPLHPTIVMVRTTTQTHTRTRTHAGQRISTLFFMLFVIAVVCSFLPLAVARADLNYDSPYGAIIGIGKFTDTSADTSKVQCVFVPILTMPVIQC